jgi:choline dehydrogenase-like flavoprotein
VTLVADAFVTKVVSTQQGSDTVATGVTWRENASGNTHSEDAKVVVMAGGCTENPRLWLNSGLPNPNGWVGQGYTDHHFDWLIGVMPFYTGTSKGPSSAARVDYPGHGALEQAGITPGFEAFSATYSDAGIDGFYDNGAPVDKAGADTLGRQVGNKLRALLSHGLDRLINVLVITDDDVEAQNRVTLSNNYPPDHNGPVAKVEFHQRNRTARTAANREFLAQRGVELLRAAGAEKVLRINMPAVILHVQSTMRMGTDPSNSVLDDNCEARFVKRLFVADNSALANSLGGPNPTLTTQALATRTAERIFTRYFGGSPWVAHESPLTSIDDKVTQAVRKRGL